MVATAVGALKHSNVTQEVLSVRNSEAGIRKWDGKEVIPTALLPRHTASEVSGIFETHWDKEDYICPKNPVGVGYIGGYGSCRTEAIEESLYLSRVLGGIPVTGIHNQKGGILELNCFIKNEAIALLTMVWERFFEEYPSGRYLQYFYREGAFVVQRALEKCPHSKQIKLIGINPSAYVSHTSNCSYRRELDLPSFSLRKQVMSLVDTSVSESVFLSSFTDPGFLVPIQMAYYNQVGFEHIPASHRIALQGEWNLVQDPQFKREIATFSSGPEQILELTNKGQLLAQLSYATLKEGESWFSERLNHLFNVVVSGLRVMDYTCGWLVGYREIHRVSHSLKFGHWPDGTRLSTGLFKDGTLPGEIYPNGTYSNGSYPNVIYPFGILPDGTFPNGSRPLGHFMSECQTVGLASQSTYLRGNFPYYNFSLGFFVHLGMYPDGIFPNGSFSHADIVSQYGNTPYGYTEYFNYTAFFSGKMVLSYAGFAFEEIKASINISSIASMPNIYPGGITPTGQFQHINFSYPFGVFKNKSFPYSNFFSGSYPYETKFKDNIDSLLKQKYLAYQSALERFRYMKGVSSYKAFGQGAIAGYWIMHATSELILLHTDPLKSSRLRATALAISATGFLMNVVDLANNVAIAMDCENGFLDLSIQTSLCCYAGFSLTRDLAQNYAPWIRQMGYDIAAIFSRIQTFPEDKSGVLVRIGKSFRKNLKRIRSFTTFLMIALMTNIFLMGRCFRSGASPLSELAYYDSLHTIVTSVVLPTTLMLLISKQVE